ncbi:hypothetical protein QVA66_08705 [Staphylococcus chromogenes]|nr:hypothetical protein [Staphylococcus chromogenes]
MPLTLRLAWRDIIKYWKRSVLGIVLFSLPVFATALIGQLEKESPVDPRNTAVANEFRASVNSIPCEKFEQPYSPYCLDDSALTQIPDLERLAAATPGAHFSPRFSAPTQVSPTLSAADEIGAAVNLHATLDNSQPPGTISLDRSDAKILGKSIGDTVAVKIAGHEEAVELRIADFDTAYRESYATGRIYLNLTDFFPNPQPEQLRSAELPPGWQLQWFATDVKEIFPDKGEVSVEKPLTQTHGLAPNKNRSLVLELVSEMNTGSDFTAVLTVTILGLILISAVTGPVFSVATRRNLRINGLLSSNGANSSHLRRIMLWHGTIIGGLGAGLGLLGAAVVGMAFGAYSPSITFRPLLDVCVALTVVAMICGLTSAVVPAILAGRMDPVAALSEAPITRMRRMNKWFVLPASITIVLLASVPFSEKFAPYAVLGAIACTIVSAPLFLFGWNWLASRLSLPLRLASRDALRNLPRTAPAAGAIAGCLLVTLVSISAGVERVHDDRALIEVQTPGASLTGPALIEKDILAVQKNSGAPIRMDSYHGFREGGYNLDIGHTRPLDSKYEKNIISNNLPNKFNGSVYVTTPESLDLLSMTHPELRGKLPHLKQSLREGKAIVESPDQMIDGKVRLFVTRSYAYPDFQTETEDGWTVGVDHAGIQDRFDFDAVALQDTPTNSHPVAIITPETARTLPIDVHYQATFLAGGKPLSLSDQIFQDFRNPIAWAENRDSYGIGSLVLIPIAISFFLTFAVTLLLVLLAAAESRKDTEMMFAVGASPSLVRRYGAAQGLTVTASGLVGAIATGLLSLVALGPVWSPGESFSLHNWLWLIEGMPWALLATLCAALLALGWLIGLCFGTRLHRRAAR